MKNIVLFFVMLFSMTMLKGQNASTINGSIVGPNDKKVTLFKVLNGRLLEIANSVPDEKGRFGFRFIPNEGLYALGTGTALNQQGINRFYFKGNDELNLTLMKDGYELVGNNSKENEALYDWDKQSRFFKNRSMAFGVKSTYVDFFPDVEAFKGKTKAIGASVNTGNPKFDKLFPLIVDFDFAYYAISYMYIPHSAHPSEEEMTPFYTEFNADRYLVDELLLMPYGDRILPNFVNTKMKSVSKPTFDQTVDAIPSGVLKGQYVLMRLGGVKSLSAFREMTEKYKDYFTLEEQQQRLGAIESKLVDNKAGGPAFQFSFEDIDSKKTSLSDLKGKVVLLDIWATWCGPCRGEEPFWEKLNDEFKGKPVAFVGISVDQDKSKWVEYLKDKKLKGIQLYAGQKNPLTEAYKVTGIPRYILIDKSGNLISPDAPRPSDAELKQMIEERLMD